MPASNKLNSGITYVINGRASDLPDSEIRVYDRNPIITPGDVNTDYDLAFSDDRRHLEEVTCQGKIWPLANSKWYKYQNTYIPDKEISPLKKEKFSAFVQSLRGERGEAWSKLFPNSWFKRDHKVIPNGLLVLKMKNDEVVVLEGENLEKYFKEVETSQKQQKGSDKLPKYEGMDVAEPLFFCDKKLGKVKPLTSMPLSYIYTILSQIETFKDSPFIIATSNRQNGHSYEDTSVKPTRIEVRCAKAQPIGKNTYELKDENIEVNLKKYIDDILNNNNIGKFTKYTYDFGQGEKHAATIPYKEKPGAQFLRQLTDDEEDNRNENTDLSSTKDKKPIPRENNKDIIIKYPNSSSLKITGKCIDKMRKSMRVYVNTDIFPLDEYKKMVGNLSSQSTARSELLGEHAQNLGTQVLQSQLFHVFAKAGMSKGKDRGIMIPRTETIDENTPAILLLSAPALNFSYGTAKNLKPDLAKEYLKGMYRLLFHAAIDQQMEYFTLPPAGLGVFGGEKEAKLYFQALMEVVQEEAVVNSKLKIIYNAGGFAPIFDQEYNKYSKANEPHNKANDSLKNLIRTDHDVLLLALTLTTKENKKCAFHNPSDADVVYGIFDIGQYWKKFVELVVDVLASLGFFVAEEFLATIGSAVLGSRLLSPESYEDPTPVSFNCPMTDKIKATYGIKKEPVVDNYMPIAPNQEEIKGVPADSNLGEIKEELVSPPEEPMVDNYLPLAPNQEEIDEAPADSNHSGINKELVPPKEVPVVDNYPPLVPKEKPPASNHEQKNEPRVRSHGKKEAPSAFAPGFAPPPIVKQARVKKDPVPVEKPSLPPNAPVPVNNTQPKFFQTPVNVTIERLKRLVRPAYLGEKNWNTFIRLIPTLIKESQPGIFYFNKERKKTKLVALEDLVAFIEDSAKSAKGATGMQKFIGELKQRKGVMQGAVSKRTAEVLSGFQEEITNHINSQSNKVNSPVK